MKKEDKFKENIYFLDTMHFDTVVPSSGVNKVKLVITENIPNTQIYKLKIIMDFEQPTISPSSLGTADIFSYFKHPTIV